MIIYEKNRYNLSDGEAIGWGLLYSIGAFILMLYFVPTGGFTGILTVFHTYLLSANKTTYEQIKKAKNTFSAGVCCNWAKIFCSKNTRSILDKPKTKEKLLQI